MRRSIGAGALLLGFGLLAGCEDTDGPDTEEFIATLSGQAENPPRATTATGSSTFTVNTNNSVSFTIDVTNLQNITMAHIHGPATATENAGVLVTLVPLGQPRPLLTGRLVQGTFTQSDAPAVVSMDSVLFLMRNGLAYVNVHTNDNVAPTNTGPGDFPGGEIRGQITER